MVVTPSVGGRGRAIGRAVGGGSSSEPGVEMSVASDGRDLGAMTGVVWEVYEAGVEWVVDVWRCEAARMRRVRRRRPEGAGCWLRAATQRGTVAGVRLPRPGGAAGE